MTAKPKERQYRALTTPFAVVNNGAKRIDTNYYVEGYASTFNDPYVLYVDYDGNEVREQVLPTAFADCDMSDIIMQFDHAGRVFARNNNGSLIVEPDDHGLFIAADLGRTPAARDLYGDIDADMIQRMSWAFTITDSDYDERDRLITIKRVGKIFDVSAVSYPADPNTEISARSLVNGVIQARQERVQRRIAQAGVTAKRIEIWKTINGIK